MRQSLADWIAMLTCAAMLFAVIQRLRVLSGPQTKEGYMIPSPEFGWFMLVGLVVVGALAGGGFAVICGQRRKALFGAFVGITVFLVIPLLMLIAVST